MGVSEVCLFSGVNHAGQEELVIAVQSDAELPQATIDEIRRRFAAFEQVRVTGVEGIPAYLDWNE